MLKISKAALIAAMLSLSIGPMLGTGPAAAAITTTTTPPTTDTSTGYTLSIPTITAVDSTMDEAALRDLFTNGITSHAGELAKLTATSITIPEITLSIKMVGNQETTVSYKDIVLTNVKDGVAESASVGSSSSSSAISSFEMGALSAKSFDIGGLLGFYGVVNQTQSTEMKVLYTDLSFAGGSFSSPGAKCTFGAITGASFSARPLKVSFADLMKASQQLEAKNDMPPPEAMRTVVRFVADIFSAFQSDPISLDGLKCSGNGDNGKPFELSIGGISMEGYEPGLYPAISVKDVNIKSNEGSVTLDAATMKTIDLTDPIAVLDAESSTLDEMWFMSNWRKLIPAFEGFSFSGLKIDVPDPQKQGSRIQANIADFDLTLSDYLNGIPTKISSHTSGFDVPLDQDKDDESIKMLLALGIDRVNLNYDLDAAWDEDSKTINITKLGVSGNDLGSIAVASVLGNAPAELFDVNPQVEQAASMGVTIKSLTFDVVDAGLGDKLVPMMAAEQGIDPAKYRSQMAGIAEGAALQMLGATDEARALGQALSGFISGAAKSLTIDVTSKDPDGVSMAQLMMAQNDPTVLANAVTITGSAK